MNLINELKFVAFFPCSLFPPYISSFPLFLCSDCHSCVNLSVWRELALHESVLVWPISSGYDVLNFFTQRKIATVCLCSQMALCPIPNSSDIRLMQKFAREKIIVSFLLEAGFKLGYPLQTILQSKPSSFELAGPGCHFPHIVV